MLVLISGGINLYHYQDYKEGISFEENKRMRGSHGPKSELEKFSKIESKH